MWWQLVLNGLLLGVGLAMDACAVSMANGMNEPKMKFGKASLIALSFGFFQALMPMIGWVCVHFAAEKFVIFNKAVPYIALALLGFIGGKMLWEGFRHNKKEKANADAPEGESEEPKKDNTPQKLTFWVLMTQSVATSIDALSVGFTISDYVWWQALISAGLIAVVTFGISVSAVYLGKKFGTKLGNKAEILGGFILIGIGIEIFVKGVFFS